MVKVTRLFTWFSYYLDFKAVEQKAHIPIEICPSKQSDSASIFVNTQFFTFQFPLLWDILLSLNTTFNLAMNQWSIPSSCQQIQTSTKNCKYKRRSIRLSNKSTPVKRCRSCDLLLQNQNSSMKVSTPLFLQILTILLSTNVCSKSISIPSKSWLYKLASKKQLSKIELVLPWSWRAPHQGVICSQPTALLQQPAEKGDSACLYTMASQKAELRTTSELLPLQKSLLSSHTFPVKSKTPKHNWIF